KPLASTFSKFGGSSRLSEWIWPAGFSHPSDVFRKARSTNCVGAQRRRKAISAFVMGRQTPKCGSPTRRVRQRGELVRPSCSTSCTSCPTHRGKDRCGRSWGWSERTEQWADGDDDGRGGHGRNRTRHHERDRDGPSLRRQGSLFGCSSAQALTDCFP